MANIAAFIPRIWSARFTSVLRATTVWGRPTNQNYRGNIARAGDTVEIPTLAFDPTVSDYVVDTDIKDPEVVAGSSQQLTIDQQKYFNFYVDDIDEFQSVPRLMDGAMREAAYAIAIEQDTFLRGKFAEGIAAGRTVTVDGLFSAASFGQKFIEALIDTKLAMDLAELPEAGRWCVVSPQIMAGLDKFFTTEGAAGLFTPVTDESTMRNGFTGRLMNFNLYKTNRPIVAADTPANGQTSHRAICGQGNEAVTFAPQITEIEAYRPEKRFGDAVKGLYVYGAHTVHKDRLHNVTVRVT